MKTLYRQNNITIVLVADHRISRVAYILNEWLEALFKP